MRRTLAVCFGKNKPDAGVAKPKARPSLRNGLSWQAWDGGTSAHPDSPDGGGGPGGFGNGVLGRDAPDAGSRPHPRAPNQWYRGDAGSPDAGVVPADGGARGPADAGSRVVNPPPLAEDDEDISAVVLHPNKTVDLKMVGKILKDKTDGDTTGTSAHTEIHSETDLQLGAQYDDKKRITKITPGLKIEDEGLPVVVITFFIQTVYQAKANPAGPSAYGRGTTEDDIQAGNTTLGFHESRHRSDLRQYQARFREYVTKHPFPQFKGKVGMSLEQFRVAKKEFLAEHGSNYDGEVDKFVSGLVDYIVRQSGQQTDEIGKPKLSEYCSQNPKDSECVRIGK